MVVSIFSDNIRGDNADGEARHPPKDVMNQVDLLTNRVQWRPPGTLTTCHCRRLMLPVGLYQVGRRAANFYPTQAVFGLVQIGQRAGPPLNHGQK